MNPYELLELKKESFTKNERIIYEYVKNHSYDIFRGTIVTMAKDAGVSQPSITRFCKKLGYESFSEFKMRLYHWEKIADDQTKKSKTHFPVLESYITLIEKIDLELTDRQLSEFASSIINAKQVYIIGRHKSKLPAELLKYNLLKFAIHASFFTSDDSFEICNIASKKDLAIIISAQGESVKNLIKELKENQIPTALVTMNSKILNKDDLLHYVWLPNYRNQHERLYTENMVVFSIFIDLLTSFVTKEYNQINK